MLKRVFANDMHVLVRLMLLSSTYEAIERKPLVASCCVRGLGPIDRVMSADTNSHRVLLRQTRGETRPMEGHIMFREV